MRIRNFVKPRVLAAPAILALGLTAACAPMHQPPKEVSSSEPTVTYKYQNDQDLFEVDRRAADYCAKYDLIPDPQNFRTDADGQRVVTYRCLPVAARTAAAMQTTTPAVPASPKLSYPYSTDRELVRASSSARAYCQNNGMRATMANTVMNANGTKTVEFQCVP